MQFLHRDYETAENSKKQRVVSLFCRLPSRRRSRISAEHTMSSADNFVEKQQKQREPLLGRPFWASYESFSTSGATRDGGGEFAALYYRNIRPCGGRPRRIWPTVSKWIGRPCPCWVPAWMSRKRRSNGFSLKIAFEPAAL